MNRKSIIIIYVLTLIFMAMMLLDNIAQTKQINELNDQLSSMNEQIVYCEQMIEDLVNED